jgi:hypothetical protein
MENSKFQHDLVGGNSASSGAELCRSCVPPGHELASLLHVTTQITVSHVVSNICFALGLRGGGGGGALPCTPQ